MPLSRARYQIRPAVMDDVPCLIDLIVAHAAFEMKRVDKAQLAQDLPRYLFAKDPRVTVLVVDCVGDLVGYGAASIEFSTWKGACFLHLDCLYLAAQSRGQGLGAQLLEAFENLARRQSLRWMEWQTPDWNVNAAAFYERNGAVAQPKLRFTKTISVTR